MPDLFPISAADQIAEVNRELGYRRRVYGRWVAEGKMKSEQATRQIAVMEAVLNTLKGLK